LTLQKILVIYKEQKSMGYIKPNFTSYLHYKNYPILEDFLDELRQYTSPDFKVCETIKENGDLPYTEVIFKKDRAEVQIGIQPTKDYLKTEVYREIELPIQEFESTKSFGQYMATYYKPSILQMMELDISNINQVVFQYSFKKNKLILKIIVPNNPVPF